MSDLDERFARALHHASQSVAFGEASNSVAPSPSSKW